MATLHDLVIVFNIAALGCQSLRTCLRVSSSVQLTSEQTGIGLHCKYIPLLPSHFKRHFQKGWPKSDNGLLQTFALGSHLIQLEMAAAQRDFLRGYKHLHILAFLVFQIKSVQIFPLRSIVDCCWV